MCLLTSDTDQPISLSGRINERPLYGYINWISDSKGWTAKFEAAWNNAWLLVSDYFL